MGILQELFAHPLDNDRAHGDLLLDVPGPAPARLSTTPDAPPPSGPDAADPDLDAILQILTGSLRDLSGRCKEEIAQAVRDSSGDREARERALAVIQKHTPELSRVLALGKLAALLVGMRRVAEQLPETHVPPTATEIPDPLADRDVESWLVQTPHGPAALTVDRPAPEGESEADSLRLPLVDEAVRALAARGVLAKQDYEDATTAARATGEAEGLALSDELANAVRAGLTQAVADGMGLDEFRDYLEEHVAPGTVLSDGWTEGVFRTGVMAAYAAGQDRILDHPVVADAFPYILREPIRDSRLTPLCEVLSYSGLNGTGVYRRDDPVWQRFRPPSHWRCRCGTIPLTVEMAAHRGVKEAQQWLRTGRPPERPAWVAPPPVELPEGWEPGGGVALGLMRLAWINKGAHPKGFRWYNDQTRQYRYQKKQPGTERGGAAAGQQAPAASPRTPAPAKTAAPAEPKQPARTSSPPPPPAPAVRAQAAGAIPGLPKPGKPLSAGDRQSLARIASEARKEMSGADHPMQRLRSRLVYASFGGGPVIKTLRSTMNNPLTARDHELMANAHARAGTILRINGNDALAKANYAAAKFHRDLAERKKTPVAKVAPPPPPPVAQAVPLSHRPEYQSAPQNQGLSPEHQAFISEHAHSITENARLSSKQKQQYHQALQRAIQRMPPQALQRMSAGVKRINFHASASDFHQTIRSIWREQLSRNPKSRPEEVERKLDEKIGGRFRGEIVGGYLPDSKNVLLDGDVLHEKDFGGHAYRASTHETYAHELTHAIDDAYAGSFGGSLSENDQWREAFKDEILSKKLSNYAATSESEGFAEFGRMLYGTNTDPARIEEAFPKCAAFFKSYGLWVGQATAPAEPAGAAAPPPPPPPESWTRNRRV